MSASTITRLRELFETLIELPADERELRLAEIVENDAQLGQKLADLLAADTNIGSAPTEPLLPELGALRKTQPDAWRDQRIGDYLIGASLGAGGMGVVYRARRDGATEDVAIKLMRADHLDAAARRRFQLERQVLASLSHPAIARLIDLGESSDGTPYAVMEFVDGIALIPYADQHRLSLRQRIELLLKVCAAVAHAHARRVVHRDLKSSNVLVGVDARPKLLDFGIAKLLHAPYSGTALEKTATAQRFFSLHNVAPEQLSGAATDIGCDVYGLGVLLYELLCGELPLTLGGLGPGQAELAILQQEPAAPSARVASASVGIANARARLRGLRDRNALADALRGNLDQIALKALRKLPTARHASVDEFMRELRAAIGGRSISARSGNRVERWRQRLASRPLALAAAACIAVVATFFALVQSRPDPRADAPDPVPEIASAVNAVPESDPPVPDPLALTERAELLLALARTRLEQGDIAATHAALEQAEPLMPAAGDLQRPLRLHWLQLRADAAIRSGDFPLAEQAIAGGRDLAATRRERAEFSLLRAALLSARGRLAESAALLRDIAADVLPYLDERDELGQRIRRNLGDEARPAAPAADIPGLMQDIARQRALQGAAQNDATEVSTHPGAGMLEALAAATSSNTVAPAGASVTATAQQRHCDAALEPKQSTTARQEHLSRCLAGLRTGGDAAAILEQQVSYARLLNQQGNYLAAQQLLDDALEAQPASTAVRHGDTYRIGVLTAAIARHGAQASTDSGERLSHELARDVWLTPDAGRAAWTEQAEIARHLGIERAD